MEDLGKTTYDTLYQKYSHLFNTGVDPRRPFPMFGFECGIGWYNVLSTLLSLIDHHFKSKYKGVPEGFAITQIKEKFGGLRFYIDGGDDVVYAYIQFAEYVANSTCEFCGSNVAVRKSNGWITTACSCCIDTNEDLKNRKWGEPINLIIIDEKSTTNE